MAEKDRAGIPNQPYDPFADGFPGREEWVNSLAGEGYNRDHWNAKYDEYAAEYAANKAMAEIANGAE